MYLSFLFISLLPVVTLSVNVNDSKAYRSVVYYPNWDIYARNFFPNNLPTNYLTHIIYAFANVSIDGTVQLSDTFADATMQFPGDQLNETGENLYGCLKQLYLLKKENRNIKVMLSIGGAEHSSNISDSFSTPAGRSIFSSSAVSLVYNLGLDGLDINWEFPSSSVDAENLVLTLQAIRLNLNAYESSLKDPYHFEVSVASSAGSSNYKTLNLTAIDAYIDFWNLMAYDYAGPWSTTTNNQANIFISKENPVSTPFSTEVAVDYYIEQGVPATKLVLGIPVYGRSFEQTDGLGTSFAGVGSGTWEAGIYDYKDLPRSGAMEYLDNETGSSYSYDAVSKELVSYDTLIVGQQKMEWIKQRDLGGAMWWEGSGDATGNLSLIQTSILELAGADLAGLANSPNLLQYPNSTYDNLRAGMQQDNGSLISGSFAALSTVIIETTVDPPPSTITTTTTTTPVVNLPTLTSATATCTSASCLTYKIRKCSSGDCFCGLDINNNPQCFSHYSCEKTCTSNDDCDEGSACLIQSCCPPQKLICNLHNYVGCHVDIGGSTCAPLTEGCS